MPAPLQEAFRAQTHAPADEIGSNTAGRGDRESSSPVKLSPKYPSSVPSQKAENSEPKPSDAPGAVVGSPTLTREPQPDIRALVLTDHRASGYVSSSGSTRISSEYGGLDSQPELSNVGTEEEAFCIQLRPAADAAMDRAATSPVAQLQGEPEPQKFGAAAQNSNDQHTPDLPALGAVGNAFRDEAPLGKTAAVSGGPTGGNMVSTQPEQALGTRGNTAKSDHDQENAAGAGDRNPNRDVLNRIEGWQPVEARAESPRTEQTASVRSTQLPELIESSRSNVANQMMVRVDGGSGQVISVHLVDQGGQVQVAVRSSDPSTAYQLRQELTTLAGNLDRIGWKSNVISAPVHESMTLHNVSGSGRNSQPEDGRRNPEWHEQSSKKRPPTPGLWDELIARQNT